MGWGLTARIPSIKLRKGNSKFSLHGRTIVTRLYGIELLASINISSLCRYCRCSSSSTSSAGVSGSCRHGGVHSNTDGTHITTGEVCVQIRVAVGRQPGVPSDEFSLGDVKIIRDISAFIV